MHFNSCADDGEQCSFFDESLFAFFSLWEFKDEAVTHINRHALIALMYFVFNIPKLWEKLQNEWSIKLGIIFK
ncbi:MAG: hypothetical protein ACRCWR_12385 [Saezia sp.]